MPTQLVVRSGPATVIAQGEATTFDGNGLRLALRVDEVAIALEFDFQSDPSVKGVRVDTVELAQGYRLTCVNFDRADGRGSAIPVLLAEVGEDLIWVHFRVFRWGVTEDRTVHYSFYRVGREQINGA